MTARGLVVLVCDDCNRESVVVAGGGRDTIAGLRSDLRSQGWVRTRAGLDRCPACQHEDGPRLAAEGRADA